MDTLADAMAGVEYYLEAARDARGGGERILAGTQRSLEALGYWPVPARRQAAERPAPAAVSFAAPDLSEAVSIAAGSDVSDLIVGTAQAPASGAQELAGLNLVETQTAAESQADQGEGEWVEVEEEVEEPVAGDAGAANFQDAAGIDEDIREVFVEEVGEEIASIRQHLPAWKADPDNLDALKSVRRSFHTLKGSGRLVGALALGEFSWKVENMLNRVLDRTIPPDPNVQMLVDHALAALPELHAALQGGEAPRAPLAAIMQAADKLAAGEPARVEDFMQTHKVRRMVGRWVPRAAEVEQVPQATLAGTVPAVETPAPQEPVFAGPLLPPVDPMLLEILRSEVAQHLSTMRDYLARADAPQPIDDAMVRAAHTLHGAVAMVDIPVLAAVLTPLESWFKRMRAARVAPDAEGIAALRDSVAMTDHVIAQFDVPEPEVPDSTALAERLARLRDTLPEAALADVLHMSDEDEVPAAITLESITTDVPVEEPVQAQEIASEPESVFTDEFEGDESAAVASFLQGIAAETGAIAPDSQFSDAEGERAAEQARAEQSEIERLVAETQG